jgi:hypothetical protein
MSFVADVCQSRKTKMRECQEDQLCLLTVWASGSLVFQSSDGFAERSASKLLIWSFKAIGYANRSTKFRTPLCLQQGRVFTSPI